MSVTVLPEIDAALRVDQSLTIQVSTGDDRAPAAMDRVRAGLSALTASGERVAYLSPVIALPGVFLLAIDFGSLPDEPVLAVPQSLARWLRDGGVTDAAVGLAPPGRLDRLEGYEPAARAYVRGSTAFDTALAWLGPGAVTLFVYGVESTLNPSQVRPVVEPILTGRGPAVTLVAGDLGDTLTAATLGAADTASLVSAGRDASPERLRTFLLHHTAGLDQAAIAVERSTTRITMPDPVTDAWWQWG